MLVNERRVLRNVFEGPIVTSETFWRLNDSLLTFQLFARGMCRRRIRSRQCAGCSLLLLVLQDRSGNADFL